MTKIERLSVWTLVSESKASCKGTPAPNNTDNCFVKLARAVVLQVMWAGSVLEKKALKAWGLYLPAKP